MSAGVGSRSSLVAVDRLAVSRCRRRPVAPQPAPARTMPDPGRRRSRRRRPSSPPAPAKDDAEPVKFDGDRAIKYLKQLCDIGPRISGTEGMKKQQELIEKHFKELGATVTRQEFKAKQRSRKSRHRRW